MEIFTDTSSEENMNSFEWWNVKLLPDKKSRRQSVIESVCTIDSSQKTSGKNFALVF